MPASLRLVRHATLELVLGGRRLLIDPMLVPAGANPPVEDTPNPVRNPLVELPDPAAELVARADGVLVTHLHGDHWDGLAAELVSDGLDVLCQPEDVDTLRAAGVRPVPVADELDWQGLRVRRTGGQHGRGELAQAMAPVSGFVLSAPGEPTVYVAGDTVWCDEVGEALALAPDVVVVNAGGARFTEGDPITMDPDDVLAVRNAAPDARLVAVHMEAINHCLVTREALRGALTGHELEIPADGETVEL